MRDIMFLLLFISNLYSIDLDNPLPKWLDKNRESVKIKKSISIIKKSIPPSDFRIPAEYEPVSVVLISYAGYTTMLKEISKAAANANAQIWVMSGPSSMSGVPPDKYVNFSIPIDSVWMRDYGPFGLSKKKEKLGIVDTVYRHYQYRTDDDAVPKNIGKIQNIDVYGADIILDGGNFMVDSYGNLYMTEVTYIWNSDKSKEQVNQILRDYFKVKNIYTFEYAGYPNRPYDGTGHIDMFMKLLNDNTVLIASSDLEPFKSTFDKASKFFEGRTSPNGSKYRVLRIKGFYKNNIWYTYTNSTIVNGYVLIPSYSYYTSTNIEAKNIYESANLKAVLINSDSSISAGGSIHCVTQTLPDIGRILKRENSIEMIKSVEEIDITPLNRVINVFGNIR